MKPHSTDIRQVSGDDEQPIAAGRRDMVGMALVALPLVVAWFADDKWVMAAGFAATVFLLNDASARLYDLCRRVRRMNRLISERGKED